MAQAEQMQIQHYLGTEVRWLDCKQLQLASVGNISILVVSVVNMECLILLLPELIYKALAPVLTQWLFGSKKDHSG
jgi:hypothetical protein